MFDLSIELKRNQNNVQLKWIAFLNNDAFRFDFNYFNFIAIVLYEMNK